MGKTFKPQGKSGCYLFAGNGTVYFGNHGSPAKMGAPMGGSRTRLYNSSKDVVANSVDFNAALDAKDAWVTFLKLTTAHSNAANALRTKRSLAVKAWFAAQKLSATRTSTASAAAKKAAAKLALRNTAAKASNDATAAQGIADTAAAAAATASKNAGVAAANAKASNLKAVNGAILAASQSGTNHAGIVGKAKGASTKADKAAASAKKQAKKDAAAMAAATTTYTSAASKAGKRVTEATAATIAMNKSKAAAMKAHSDYSSFVTNGSALGYVH